MWQQLQQNLKNINNFSMESNFLYPLFKVACIEFII